MIRILVALVVLVTAAVLLDPDPAPRVLDARHATYLEDEHTGRRLAAIELRLQRRDAAVELRIDVSALGPDVQPVPGFRGIHGANHITARELTAMVAREQLRVVAVPRGATGKRIGRVRATAHGHLPERRLQPGGELNFDSRSADRYVLSVRGVSPPLAPGDHEVYLEAKGIPRLRVDVAVDAGGYSARIREVQSLAGHDLGEVR